MFPRARLSFWIAFSRTVCCSFSVADHGHKPEEVYAFWQQHVANRHMVQSRSGASQASRSIAAPPSSAGTSSASALLQALSFIGSSAGHDLQPSSPSFGFLSPKNEVYPVNKIRNRPTETCASDSIASSAARNCQCSRATVGRDRVTGGQVELSVLHRRQNWHGTLHLESCFTQYRRAARIRKAES